MILPANTALQIIREAIVPLPPVTLPLAAAAGLVLSEPLFATTDLPPFNQSSMDGYAFLFNGWQTGQRLQVSGEIAAGHNQAERFLPGQAVRIFTGAPVPEGTDTVVMQEKVVVGDGQLSITDDRISPGSNVRLKGSDITAGALALEAGTLLTPGAIGFLAGIGVTTVNAYPKPSISIIVTGKELQVPGKLLSHGQVYESNSATLTAALLQLNIHKVTTHWADDDLPVLTHLLQQALQESDVVLLTGGVSVGDYDFVVEATRQCSVKQLFHRLKQKPGKPLYFGKKNHQLVVGLPGNPSSVLTCFYQYVVPALYRLGNRPGGLFSMRVPIASEYKKPADITHFLKGWYDGEKVSVLGAQESYRLSSFAMANCLVKVEEYITHCAAGDSVEIQMLPS